MTNQDYKDDNHHTHNDHKDVKDDSHNNHNDHHGNYEVESAVKHEMSKKLRNFYDYHQRPLLFRPLEWFKFETKHQSLDLTHYEHSSSDNFNEKQKVQRTVFALQKLKTFNHHFFSHEEQRILNPLSLGTITYAMWFSFAGFNALYLSYLWRTQSFNPKSVGFLVVGMAVQSVISQIPNALCENVIQNYRRKQLANRYLSVYGYEFFHNVVNPKFNLFELEHMHNIAQTH